MDTRFWGPSGWRLLHLISFQATSMKHTDVALFVRNLPFVLPCKFCRASLAEYYESDPVPAHPKDYPKWLYRIHNKVNAKLREQKLLTLTDPKWSDIEKTYRKWLDTPCSNQTMIGWDFLFSVAYTTPCPSVHSSPMPNAPPIPSMTSAEERNRWGVISRAERLPYIQAWWDVLPSVLPYKEWTKAWLQVVPPTPSVEQGRRQITTWLFHAEKAMCKKLNEEAPHSSYSGLCNELQTFSSGCGKRVVKVKTCRATKRLAKHTLKQRRTSMYTATGGYL